MGPTFKGGAGREKVQGREGVKRGEERGRD